MNESILRERTIITMREIVNAGLEEVSQKSVINVLVFFDIAITYFFSF